MPPGGQASERPPRRGIARSFLGTEDALFTYVDQLAEARAGQRAMIVHLSRLDRSHRNDKHLQIVANMLQQVMEQYPGRLFALDNGDVVAICKGITRRAFDETTELFRYLFNDDPLAAESVQRADFCALFDLEIDYPQFLSALEDIREAALRQSRATARVTPPLATSAVRSPRIDEDGPLARAHRHGEPCAPPDNMANVAGAAARSGLGRDIHLARSHPQGERRQCRAHQGSPAAARPDASAGPAPPRHRRPLPRQRHAPTQRRHPPGDAVVAGVRRFRQEPGEIETRDRIVFEMQLAELTADLPGYLSASKRLQEQGYRRCLDGVSHQALLYINFRRLDVDYVKVVWDAALLQADDDVMRELRDAIADCGTERIILTRCGRCQAIDVGQAMGIELFQGWQVDQANRN
jgi:hypothetical protein